MHEIGEASGGPADDYLARYTHDLAGNRQTFEKDTTFDASDRDAFLLGPLVELSFCRASGRILLPLHATPAMT